MMKAGCAECSAIAREIRDAYRETWLSASPELRLAWLATSGLRGGTEEDVLRLEELLPAAERHSSPRIGNALRRRFAHEARAGHKPG
jgi:hypothetical protein